MTRLPREAYLENAWHAREQRQLFADSWVFAGLKSDIENAGDYLTVNAGAFSIAVIKSKTGALNAVHNICRHRGAELLEGNYGNAGKSLVCPYHRWTYGLDGSFRGAPHMAACFPDLDRNKFSLKPAAVGVFRELIFVNPNPNADFCNWIGPLTDKAWPHDLAAKDLREGAPLLYDLKCDWKVFIENAIDGYHLAYLHEHTLGGPEPDKNTWERAGDHLIWYATDEGVRHRLPHKARDESKGAPKVKSAAKSGYGGVYYLFPATIIVPTPYGLSISTLEPISPGRCKMHVRNWVGPWQSKDERKHVPGYDKTTGVISSENWTKHPLETGDFQTEDVWICEKVQKGIKSPACEFGPFAKGAGAETPIEWFHLTFLRALDHN